MESGIRSLPSLHMNISAEYPILPPISARPRQLPPLAEGTRSACNSRRLRASLVAGDRLSRDILHAETRVGDRHVGRRRRRAREQLFGGSRIAHSLFQVGEIPEHLPEITGRRLHRFNERQCLLICRIGCDLLVVSVAESLVNKDLQPNQDETCGFCR